MKHEIDAAMLLRSGRGGVSEDVRQELDLLWKLTHGTIWDTETDSAEAYQKTVPAGAVAAEIGSIGGKTVAWNQQNTNPHFAGTSGYAPLRSTLSPEDGTLTVRCTSTSLSSFGFYITTSLILGHKYLFVIDVDAYSASLERAWVGIDPIYPSTSLTGAGKYAILFTASTGSLLSGFSASATHIGDYFTLTGFWCIDLTQMFGSGNEPTTTDAPRIAAILAYTEAHPEYDSGSLLSAAVTGIVSKNADAETLDTLEIPTAVRALEGYGESAVGGDGNTLNLADGTYTEIGHYADGVWTALDTPVVTDVSALLPDNMLDVEAGGSLTFVQDGTAFPVPNSADYLIKLSEVTV